MILNYLYVGFILSVINVIFIIGSPEGEEIERLADYSPATYMVGLCIGILCLTIIWPVLVMRLMGKLIDFAKGNRA